MKISRLALAHDWVLQRRGAERLLREFCSVNASVSIYTLFLSRRVRESWLRPHSVFVSPLGRLPGVERYYRFLLPFFPRAARALRAENADLLISIHHSAAKAVSHDPSIPHICYCLTPMRYLWRPEVYGSALAVRRRLLNLLAPALRKWDLDNSSVTEFVAISSTISCRIRDIYGLDSHIIYPGADLDFFQRQDVPRDDFYLVVSALVPQKRLELAVQAFTRNGRRLVVAGDGPCRRRLESMAGENIIFLGRRSDEEIRELYSRARALIFPGEEDFGLVPVEAQACGCPVLAYGRGGVTETVAEGRTGLFFQEQTAESLQEALDRLDRIEFDPTELTAGALRFSLHEFRHNWNSYLARFGFNLWNEPFQPQSSPS